jgi:outer membrane biosynthesis protein TonB
MFAPQGQFAQTAQPKSLARKSVKKTAETVYKDTEVTQQADLKNIDAVLSDFSSRMHCEGEGVTTISAVLRKTGKVTDVKITTTMGCKVPAQAVAAIRKIKFTPAKKNGQPVSQLYELDIKQELQAIPNVQDGTKP